MEVIGLGNEGTAGPSRAPTVWSGLWRAIDALPTRADGMPLRVVVLVPFAQLRLEAAAAWRARRGAAVRFAPRFETTRSWAQDRADALGYVPRAGSLGAERRLDWIEASGRLNAAVPAHAQALVPRVVEVCGVLGGLAAACAPQARSAWLAACLSSLGLGGDEAPSAERAALRAAVQWAAQSEYTTDVLWQSDALFGVDTVIEVVGLQADAFTRAWSSFAQSVGVVWRAWDAVDAALAQPRAVVRLSECANPSEEVARCAAGVWALLRHEAPEQPLALVAQDRALVRRVGAELAAHGVSVRDETGWLLSTSRAAHWVLGAVEAASGEARTRAVLDWARDARVAEPAALDALERAAGEQRWALWRAAAAAGSDTAVAIEQVLAPLRSAARHSALPLADWLARLGATLRAAPAQADWALDVAYQRIAAVLGFEDAPQSTLGLSLSGFARWVNHALESATFTPVDTPLTEAQVVVLPPEALLARRFSAVVFGGASEPSLSVSAAASLLSESQRVMLGLPSFEARVAQLARTCALAEHAAPELWVLWHQREGSEEIAPSVWAQRLREAAHAPAPDARARRDVQPQPQTADAPELPLALMPKAWSATAYAALRACPYRFFALRGLRLRAPEDPEREADARDWGLWLHDVLSRFHERFDRAALWRNASTAQLREALDACAQAAQAQLRLPEADALTYAAAWPRVRERYLAWLGQDAALAVSARETSLGRTEPEGLLRGQIDRVDEMPGGGWRVIDYKTAASAKTAERAREPLEDIQIAWYAALWSAQQGPQALERVQGGYLAIHDGRNDKTALAEVADLPEITQQLLSGWAQDMAELRAGKPLPAIGAARTCAHCDARGLCRQDFWSEPA